MAADTAAGQVAGATRERTCTGVPCGFGSIAGPFAPTGIRVISPTSEYRALREGRSRADTPTCARPGWIP